MSFEEQHHILENSPFLKQLVERQPTWLKDLHSGGRLECSSPPDIKRLEEMIDATGLDPALRQFRNQEMMRLIWRDQNDLAPVDEILLDLTTLADVCLQAAVSHHTAVAEKRYGTPRNPEGLEQKLIVIGLGKQGGGELNLSSDIDIIFCYPERGHCDGRRGLETEQFFTRLARSIIHSLSQVTVDGFCFRVDTRLRPFGDSGPLVSSFAALEQYYQREGRDWERYALIKARPVAGDLDSGFELLSFLRPFVYRRYIDYGAIEALREMHANVREDAMRKDRLDDIKRGPGGIREIEFLVQTFQLLRGGREKTLQTPSLFTAAAELVALDLMPAATVEQLMDAYRFLRRTENRIQALHDQQTHTVPVGDDGLRVARAMGFKCFQTFEEALKQVRSLVQDLFEKSLPQSDKPAAKENPFSAYWQAIRNRAQASGTHQAESKPLADFVRRLNRLSLSQRASRRLDEFMPILLQQFEAISADDAVVQRVLDLVSAICRRSAYLSLLVQNPIASQRMVELFAISKRVATTVTRYPALLDELIDPSLGAHPPTIDAIETATRRILDSGQETEVALQDLNYFKLVTSLRVSVAVLKSTMSSYDARMTLSILAENLVEAVLSLSLSEVRKRHGQLPGPELAVIGYGSLGAQALGFDSDLDLIFLYQATDDRSDGNRPLSAERYHTSVARRMLSLMSANTPSGRLYSIDARLRPNGRSGLLVSSLEAFQRYQLEEAWVWELQALTRARAVAGSRHVSDTFNAIRQQVLSVPRERESTTTEVRDMRERIRKEHTDPASLKHGHGGLLDIEFVVQLGLLLNVSKFPDTVCPTEISRQLQFLHECGWIKTNSFNILNDAYQDLTRARQQTALLDEATAINSMDLLGASQSLCRDILG